MLGSAIVGMTSVSFQSVLAGQLTLPPLAFSSDSSSGDHFVRQPSGDQPPSKVLKSTRKLLFVDDEPDIPMLLATLLGMEGYTSLTADSRAAAVAVYSSQPPRTFAFVLSDVAMETGDAGLHLHDDLRALGFDGTYAFMSGHLPKTDPHLMAIRALYPNTPLYTKPMEIDDLVRLVGAVFTS